MDNIPCESIPISILLRLRCRAFPVPLFGRFLTSGDLEMVIEQSVLLSAAADPEAAIEPVRVMPDNLFQDSPDTNDDEVSKGAAL